MMALVRRGARRWLVGGLIALSLVGCSPDEGAGKMHGVQAEQNGDDIVIGLAWPFSSAKGDLWNGAQLAAEELNARGGILGRKIKLLRQDDEGSLAKGLAIANKFAENQNVVAVLGHLNSGISIPASAIYEAAGIVMLSPGSSGRKLTQQGFRHVFRSIPNNQDQGEQLGDYAWRKHYKRLIVFYIDNAYGRDLADSFIRRAATLEMKILDRRAYDETATDFRGIFENWKKTDDFDAIFLAGSLPDSAEIIKQIREAGITAPIIGGAGLDSDELIRRGGVAVEGTVVTSFFHPDDPRLEVQRFNDLYRRRFGGLPDASAAGGYDGIRLLAYAIEKAGSSLPDKIAGVLRHTRNWRGVTGVHTFDDKGDVVGKRVVLKIVRNGRFEYLAE